MAKRAFLRLMLGLEILSQGMTALVKTQESVIAILGEEARVSCQLTQYKDVHQVTWQKMLPEVEKNLATYSEHFGPRMNKDFQGKVEVKGLGLLNCTLVISEVTEQDEGCYRCLFNTYPNGAFSGTTCLMLSELHEPILRVGDWNSSSESVVSCSATGRPAPTVRLSVTQPQLRLSHYDTVSVNNNNGTVTVTTSAVLSGVHNSGAQVGCAVRALSGQKEAFMMIPEVKPTPAGDENLIRAITVGVCVFLVILVSFVFIKQKSNTSSSANSENSCSSPIRTLLAEQKKEQLRQRTPAKKDPLPTCSNTLAPKQLVF